MTDLRIIADNQLTDVPGGVDPGGYMLFSSLGSYLQSFNIERLNH